MGLAVRQARFEELEHALKWTCESGVCLTPIHPSLAALCAGWVQAMHRPLPSSLADRCVKRPVGKRASNLASNTGSCALASHTL